MSETEENVAENIMENVEEFNPQEFAENLSTQAAEIIPEEISDEDKEFIRMVIHKFCFLAGDAIIKDENINFDAAQASLVAQFIGEWTFHKSIDLARAGIDINLREGILQKIAFTIFEIAKQAIMKNLPQDQLIPLVEHHVDKSYKAALEDLKNRNVISEELMQNAESQSNVDSMVAAEEHPVISQMSDRKLLKLASVALILKNLNENKKQTMLSKFNDAEAQILNDYLKMEDLEGKVDVNITSKCISEVKAILPTPKFISGARYIHKLHKLIPMTNITFVKAMIETERPLIGQLIKSAAKNEEVEISSGIAGALFNYIQQKAT
ncbi:hypothetical protein IKA15_05615 [bacterium]|nr:hypothetical protein [bacterium]